MLRSVSRTQSTSIFAPFMDGSPPTTTSRPRIVACQSTPTWMAVPSKVSRSTL